MVLLESSKLPSGMRAIDFSLPGVDGKNHFLRDFADRKILVIIFMCNHCPYVQAVIERIVKIQNDYSDKGVQVIGINANDPAMYPGDSFENMKEFAADSGLTVYLFDESQEVARAYGAQCTPDIYVFDEKRELAYHGRIDDNWQNPEAVKKEELREALDVLIAGEKPSDDHHPSMGCSIKWRE